VGAFLVRRLALAVVVVALVSLGTFVLIATHFSSICASQYTPPGERFPPLAGTVGQATRLYWRWVRGIPSGTSFGAICGSQTTQNMRAAFEHTGILLLLAAVLVVVVSLAIGTLAATQAGSLLDLALRGLSYVGWAIPAFVLALVLQSVIEWASSRHGFRLLATGGWPGDCPYHGSIVVPGCAGAGSGLGYVGSVLRHLVAPAVALATAFIGLHSRYVRSALIVQLQAPYATTARAKGVPEWIVVFRHALRNALGTFASAVLLDLGAIFGAAMAVDWVFQLNGVGSLLISDLSGVGSGDNPRFLNPYAVETLLAAAAVLVAAGSLVAELVVLRLDPRARP
jgi:peptide/nickel transport system permease protein